MLVMCACATMFFHLSNIKLRSELHKNQNLKQAIAN
jgi:hypothetical protein